MSPDLYFVTSIGHAFKCTPLQLRPQSQHPFGVVFVCSLRRLGIIFFDATRADKHSANECMLTREAASEKRMQRAMPHASQPAKAERQTVGHLPLRQYRPVACPQSWSFMPPLLLYLLGCSILATVMARSQISSRSSPLIIVLFPAYECPRSAPPKETRG